MTAALSVALVTNTMHTRRLQHLDDVILADDWQVRQQAVPQQHKQRGMDSVELGNEALP